MKFDIKSIFLPEITQNETFAKDMELDGALPEYAPDITKLVRIDARIGKAETVISAGKADITCKVDFGILYESDYKSKLAYVVVPGMFTQAAECPKIEGENYPSASVSCAYLTCKLLGPRKFVIRAKMNTDLAVTEIREIKAVDSDSSQVNAYYLTDKIVVNTSCGIFTENFSFSEAFALEHIVDHVIYAEGDGGVPEVQVAEGRLTIKSNVALKIFYETEDGFYNMETRTLPVTLLFENETITPAQTFRVRLTMQNVEADTETDDYGDNKMVRVNFVIDMTAACFEETEETVASDGFCGDRESSGAVTPVTCHSLCAVWEKTFSFDKTHDTEKTDIKEILDTAIVFAIDEKTLSDGVLTIKGNADVEVLARTENGVISEDFGVEIDESFVLDCGGQVATEVALKAVDINASVYGGENINVRAVVCVRANVYDAFIKNVLTEFTADDDAKVSEGGIRFYYPEKAETAWSVAKKYKRNPKKLIEDNHGAFEADGKLKSQASFVAIR